MHIRPLKGYPNNWCQSNSKLSIELGIKFQHLKKKKKKKKKKNTWCYHVSFNKVSFFIGLWGNKMHILHHFSH